MNTLYVGWRRNACIFGIPKYDVLGRTFFARDEKFLSPRNCWVQVHVTEIKKLRSFSLEMWVNLDDNVIAIEPRKTLMG